VDQEPHRDTAPDPPPKNYAAQGTGYDPSFGSFILTVKVIYRAKTSFDTWSVDCRIRLTCLASREAYLELYRICVK
jgi:hypothetical protein